MADELYGGAMNGVANSSNFNDSMAWEIEKALDEVRQEEGLPPLPPPADTQELRDRRIFFIAIARGVINHLKKNEKAFEIKVKVENHPSVTTYPDIDVKT